jgi:hypothetical protein
MIKALDLYPVAMFKHKFRKCVYQEIEACRNLNKAPGPALDAHLEIIRSRGIPENWGLIEAPVISRKHHDPLCITIMDKWWESGGRRLANWCLFLMKGDAPWHVSLS